MGTDLISVIEYGFCEEIESCDFQLLRSVVDGELFLPRSPEIHHALGLRKSFDFLPAPLIPLRGFPQNLSQQTVETHCAILSEKSVEEVRSRTGHQNLVVINLERYEELLPHHGTSEPFKLKNRDEYFGRLEPDEEVVMGLGTLCPSWMYSCEILEAVAHCGLNINVDDNDDSNLAHFGTVVEWMQSLERVYGKRGVRLVFWYDQLPDYLLGIEGDD